MTRESLVRIAARSRRMVSALALMVVAVAAGCAGARVDVHGGTPDALANIFAVAGTPDALGKFVRGSDILKEDLRAACREWIQLSPTGVGPRGETLWQRESGGKASGGIDYSVSGDGKVLSLEISRSFANDKKVALLLILDVHGEWSTPTVVSPDALKAGETLHFRIEGLSLTATEG